MLVWMIKATHRTVVTELPLLIIEEEYLQIDNKKTKNLGEIHYVLSDKLKENTSPLFTHVYVLIRASFEPTGRQTAAHTGHEMAAQIVFILCDESIVTH